MDFTHRSDLHIRNDTNFARLGLLAALALFIGCADAPDEVPATSAPDGALPTLVLEACDTAAALLKREVRDPLLRQTSDSLLPTGHPFAGRHGCVVVVNGSQDSTGLGPDDLRAGLPGAAWLGHPSYDSDGAGSTGFAIWRPGVLCLINWEVPAGLDESGQAFSGSSEHVEVACVAATLADMPDTTQGT